MWRPTPCSKNLVPRLRKIYKLTEVIHRYDFLYKKLSSKISQQAKLLKLILLCRLKDGDFLLKSSNKQKTLLWVKKCKKK